MSAPPAPATTTNTAYTACAWVKFSSLTGNHTLVSIDGAFVSAFFLKRDTTTAKFQMVITGSDAASPSGFVYATGTTVPVTGTWYHVCGVNTGSVTRVFVNGAQEGADVAVPSDFAATGNTYIGVGKYNNTRVDYTRDDRRGPHLQPRAVGDGNKFALHRQPARHRHGHAVDVRYGDGQRRPDHRRGGLIWRPARSTWPATGGTTAADSGRRTGAPRR